MSVALKVYSLLTSINIDVMFGRLVILELKFIPYVGLIILLQNGIHNKCYLLFKSPSDIKLGHCTSNVCILNFLTFSMLHLTPETNVHIK
jgi:hypothetical protein